MPFPPAKRPPVVVVIGGSKRSHKWHPDPTQNRTEDTPGPQPLLEGSPPALPRQAPHGMGLPPALGRLGHLLAVDRLDHIGAKDPTQL